MSLDKISKEKRDWIKETAQKAVKYASTMSGEEAVKTAITEESMGAGESRLVCQIFNNFRTIDQFEKGSSIEEKLSGPSAVDFRDINSDLFTPEQRKEAVDKNRNKIANDWYDKNASAERALSTNTMEKTASKVEPVSHDKSSALSENSTVGEEAISTYEKSAKAEKMSNTVEALESELIRKRAIMDDLMLEFKGALHKAAEAIEDYDFGEIESRIRTDLGVEGGVVMNKLANKVNCSSRGEAEDKIVVNSYDEEPYTQIKEAVDIVNGMSEGKDILEDTKDQLKKAGKKLLKLSDYDRGTMNWLERHGAIELKGAGSSLSLGESFLDDKESELELEKPAGSPDENFNSVVGTKAQRATDDAKVYREGLKLEGNPSSISSNTKRIEDSVKDEVADGILRKALGPLGLVGRLAGPKKEELNFEVRGEGIADKKTLEQINAKLNDPGDLSDEEITALIKRKKQLEDLKSDTEYGEIASDQLSSLRDGVRDIPSNMFNQAKSTAQAIQQFIGEELPEGYTGLDADFANKIKKIQLQDFVNRLKSDDTLEGYTNREIATVVNDVVETAPGILNKPMVGTGLVKKLLESGRYVDPVEMAELVDKIEDDSDDSTKV